MLMMEALSPTEDLGVRLAASNALKKAIDDFQFNPDEFAIFLEPTFTLLFALLKEVDECDTKVRGNLKALAQCQAAGNRNTNKE